MHGLPLLNKYYDSGQLLGGSPTVAKTRAGGIEILNLGMRWTMMHPATSVCPLGSVQFSWTNLTSAAAPAFGVLGLLLRRLSSLAIYWPALDKMEFVEAGYLCPSLAGIIIVIIESMQPFWLKHTRQPVAGAPFFFMIF